MTLSTGHVILASLVAMVAAAPTADHRTDGQEVAVSFLSGDSGALTRAKRAKEEVVYGNQQNVAKAPASAAKKSVVGGFHFPPLMPSGLLPPDSPPEGPDTFPSLPQHFGNKMDLGVYPYFASKPQRPKGEPDKAGFMYASRQRPIEVNPVLEETASELQAAAPAPPSGGGGSEKEGEGEKQKESPEQKSTAQSAVNMAGEEKPTAEPVKGKPDEPTPQQSPNVEESDEGGEDSWESSEAQMKAQNEAAAAAPSSEAVESEVRIPQGSGPPLDSRLADAEEALHAEDQAMGKDDMEIFLKELQQPKEITPAANYDKAIEEEEGEDVKDGLEEAKEEEEKEEEEKEGEGSAEAELMGVVDADAEAAEKSGIAESGDYAKQLLKYILLNGNEYGRVSYPGGFPSYSSPYYARRRRSLAPRRRGLPHIHRRRRSGQAGATGQPQQLGRSKRTKRDLLDDELYYNPEAQYAFQQAVEEEEEEERQAEMEDLISYLMALYPAIYDNQPPPRGSPYPGYMWYGNNYPEEAYPEWQAPEYMEAPFAEWEPPTQPAPAWEPAFYPEEVEEQGYYPTPGKRVSRRGRQFQRRDSAYPYGQEAYWGALVPAPEERAYEDAYQRLQDLATVLGDARQPPVYSLDAFSDYRKK